MALVGRFFCFFFLMSFDFLPKMVPNGNLDGFGADAGGKAGRYYIALMPKLVT